MNKLVQKQNKNADENKSEEHFQSRLFKDYDVKGLLGAVSLI